MEGPVNKGFNSLVYVKVKPGRKAFFQGKVLPHDKFVPVTDNPYTRRLVHVWKDLIVEGGEEESKGKAQLKEKQPMTVSGGKSASEPPAPGTGSPAPKPA